MWLFVVASCGRETVFVVTSCGRETIIEDNLPTAGPNSLNIIKKALNRKLLVSYLACVVPLPDVVVDPTTGYYPTGWLRARCERLNLVLLDKRH